MNLIIIVGVFFLFSPLVLARKSNVEELFYWKKVVYEDLPLDENAYIGPYSYYIPSNADLIGIGYHAKSGLMVTTVGRYRPGIPSTLNAFCTFDYAPGSSPRIWGFPDYKKNTLKTSFYGEHSIDIRRNYESRSRSIKYSAGYLNYFLKNLDAIEGRRLPSSQWFNNNFDFKIISVYHPIVDDQCDRLFVLDTGTLYYGENEIYKVQNPALIIFDLQPNCCRTRRFPVIRRVEIPQHLYRKSYGFLYATPDYQGRDSCNDPLIYITNVIDNSIIVYDYRTENFWLVRNYFMNPILAESQMSNENFHYNLTFGIINVALGRPDRYGNRLAYFAPGASTGEYVFSTKILKDQRKLHKFRSDDFSLVGYRGCNSQTFRQVYDPNTGVIFFGEIQSGRVSCWNVWKPLNPDTVGVVHEFDENVFVSEIFLDLKGYLWFHTSRLSLSFFSETPLDMDKVNARTFRVSVINAIRGTVCDISYEMHTDGEAKENL